MESLVKPHAVAPTGYRKAGLTFLDKPDAVVFFVLAGLGALLFAFNIFRYWYYTVDDAYITMRFAQNLVNGHGFVYNPGGPVVEGYSSTSLLGWQALVILLGGDSLHWTKWLGTLAGATTLTASVGLAWRLISPDGAVPRSLAALPALLLADSLSLATGCISGLETTLFAALLTVGVWAFVELLREDAPRGAMWVAGIAMGLATWTRPEGIAWAGGVGAAVLAWQLWRRRPWRRAAIAFATAIGFWIALLVFRLLVFGQWQPNTYYAKMWSDTWSRSMSGLTYLRDWLVISRGALWLLLAGAAIPLLPRAMRPGAVICLLAVLGHCLVVVYMGGDWIPHLRFMAPMLGVAAALAGVGIALLSVRVLRRAMPYASMAVGAAACIGVILLAQPDNHRGLLEIYTRVWGWSDGHKPLAEWLGAWQADRNERMTVAVEDIGLIGWHGGTDIIDIAGLVDPDWARQKYETGDGDDYPSHKLLEETRPEVVILVATRPPNGNDPGITWKANKKIYDDPLFEERYFYHTTFLHKDYPGDGYYLHVFVRKDLASETPRANPPVPRARRRAE